MEGSVGSAENKKGETDNATFNLRFPISLGIWFSAATIRSTADKIRIGLPGDAGHFTFPLAQKRGFLREEGFEAEIITITGPVANIALSNGDIDYYTGFGSAMRSMLRDPGRVVACYRPSPHFVLLGRPELKSVKDLKGKTIGVAIGSGPDLVARLMIKNIGLDPDKDMKFVAGGGNEGAFARMKQGLIDATSAPVPWDYRAKKMGFIVLARAETLYLPDQRRGGSHQKDQREAG